MYTDSDIAHILTDDRFFLIYLRRYVLKGGFCLWSVSTSFLKLDHNISAGHAKSDYNDSNEKIWSLYVS